MHQHVAQSGRRCKSFGERGRDGSCLGAAQERSVIALRRGAIPVAERLVAESVDDFVEEVATRRLDPAVIALRDYVTATIDREMGHLRRRLPPDVAGEVDRSMHRIGRSLLHTPTIRARALARDGDGARYVDALHTLFGIDARGTGDDGPAETAHGGADDTAGS